MSLILGTVLSLVTIALGLALGHTERELTQVERERDMLRDMLFGAKAEEDEPGENRDPLTIEWGTILRQMIRHRCGPARAADHELAWRYDEGRGGHLPQAERAAMLRGQSQGAPVIVWDMRKPCRGRNSNVCVGEGCYGEACLRNG